MLYFPVIIFSGHASVELNASDENIILRTVKVRDVDVYRSLVLVKVSFGWALQYAKSSILNS